MECPMNEKTVLLERKVKIDRELLNLQSEKNTLIAAILKNRNDTHLQRIHQINMRMVELQVEIEKIKFLLKNH